MQTVYVRELSFHSPQSLSRLLSIDATATQRLIERLCAHGVLKLSTDNDGEEYDADFGDDVRGKYQFAYVGLALVDDLCFIVYPKYLPLADAHDPGEDAKAAMRQIFRVLRKRGGSYSQIAAMTEEGLRANDRLALMLALLEYYDEYGVYSNYVRTLADNGPGNINWERTINANLPYLTSGRPIYMQYKTDESDQDAADFVMRLHQCVLTRCSAFMQDSGLADLLALDEVWLSDAEVGDFGDADFIIYCLQQERAVQYVTWKQDVIDLLLRYVGEGDSTVQLDAPLCLGSSSFYHVWEAACKVAFNDVLGKRIGDLGLDLAKDWAARKNETVLGIIPRPKWSSAYGVPYGEVLTLIPDTVLLAHDAEGRSVFAILDAKYYTPMLGDKVTGAPGVESVTKQFLYQAAYRKFIEDNGFDSVVNAFIAPTSEGSIQHSGRVSFPMVIPEEKEPLSNVVELFKIPATRVFDAYLSDSSLDSASLLTIIG
jgi:hypothetical protein